MPGRLGTKAHGAVTVGLTAIRIQLQDLRLASLYIYNAGPGNMAVGTSGVLIGNSPPFAPLQHIVLDRSADDTWVVCDQAGTSILFLREVDP